MTSGSRSVRERYTRERRRHFCEIYGLSRQLSVSVILSQAEYRIFIIDFCIGFGLRPVPGWRVISGGRGLDEVEAGAGYRLHPLIIFFFGLLPAYIFLPKSESPFPAPG